MRKKCRARRCKRIIEPELIKIINEYLFSLEVTDRAEATTEKYRRILLQFFRQCKKPIRELTCDDVLDWLDTLVFENKSKRTIALYFAVLNNFFKYCLGEEHINKTLVKRRWRTKIPSTLPKFLDRAEIARLKICAEKLSLRDRAIIIFLLSSGCRRSEVSGLDIEDIDLDNRTANVLGKGNKKREVHFSIECALLLKEYLAIDKRDKGPLFLNKHGKRLKPKGIYRVVVKLKKMADFPENLSPHSFRHTFAYELQAKGADLNFIASELGHEDLNTTRIYTQVLTRDLIAAYNKRMGWVI
ncbi:MAG: tyrosine-type recombinase/integrase [Clostridiaceae bacterium]|jgi:integrase/recombinase XerD|nr:tyrosine-type recombinase/integrase [Clostridiaceae bacterium]